MESKFQEVVSQCDQVCEALNALRMTVIEDRPLKDVVKLVDRIGDDVEDLLGAVQEMRQAASEAQLAATHPIDAEQVRRALTCCHTKFNDCTRRLFSDLAGYETVEEIVSLGRQRGGEWQAWARLVQDTLKECQQSLFAVSEPLVECWQTITERAGLQSITVQSTGIGSVGHRIRRV